MKTKTKGQALTEFALILPLLLLLILGVIEGGRIIWAYVQVQNAAREAARYAVSGQPWGRPVEPERTQDCAVVAGSSEGDPWICGDPERVERIKDVAVSYGTGLVDPDLVYGLANTPGTTDNYDLGVSTPGAFGVLVKGQQSATDTEGEVDYPGRPGLNVLVQLYYNIEIIDPIYRAILPGGWVRINAQVLMQNEGIDTTASGLAPVGLAATPPQTGGGGAPPGGSHVPRISIAEVQPVPAGSTITILLEEHTPGTSYDVYFDDVLVGSAIPNAQYFASLTYYVPIDKAGYHTLHSESGAGLAASTTIEVTEPTGPAIMVDNGTRWPSGSPITIRILKHDPNVTYVILFAGNPIGTITTDSSGAGTLAYTIPAGQSAGSVYIESRTQGGSFIVGTTITIMSPSIVIQGGTVWPQGTRIFIILRDHAPGQTYSVYFQDTLISNAVTTNAIGEAILSYTIPAGLPDGTYVVMSRQGSATIAQINVQVATPPTPYIVIPGGYEWPAGSPITIQLRKHSANQSYDVYFGDNDVGRFQMDAYGEYSIAYVIPVAQPTGVVSLRSVRVDNGLQEASRDVTVTAVPVISVDGGLTQAPGTAITIRLTHHAANAAYDVYLGGTKIGTVTTSSSGEGSLAYTIPPGTTPGAYLLESKPKDETTVIASAILTVRAPDLIVTSIQTPATPVFNTPMPITITLVNSSTKAISNQYFDVDLYIDPTLAPSASDAGLPPGSEKYWYNSIPASGTLIITDTITLWGPKDHAIYARADTSGSVLESNENNNILGKLVTPAACSYELVDEFTGSGPLAAAWNTRNYGDAAPSPAGPYLLNDRLVLDSRGQSNYRNNDDASNSGFQFVYQQLSGDFDVYVQVWSFESGQSSVSGKAGLEIRNSLDSQDLKVDWVLYQGYRLQAAQRSSYGGSVAQIGGYVYPTPAAPILLRIVRRGNEFSLYYSTATVVPPQPGDWLFLRSQTVAMGSSVYVGMLNVSYLNSGSPRWSRSTFDHFHLCGDPAGAYTCGEVQEASGAVFVDAINYTDSLVRGGQAWTTTTRAGLVGMAVPNAGVTIDPTPRSQVETTSPELRYQVKFSTAGRYYIGLLGWGPDSASNSVHMGLGGTLTDNTDDIESFTTNSANPPQWITSAAWYVDIPSAGSYTLNLYMREDGTQVYKIALFINSGYPLIGFGPSQSPCTVSVPQELPPGYTRCGQALINGDFEGDLLTDVLPYWVMAEQEYVGRTSVHYISPGTSFGVLLPSSDAGTGTPKQPWVYQEFAMPDWVLTTTTAMLNLQKGVDWLGAPQNEQLYFCLRSTSGVTLTTLVDVASGQDLPDLDPGNYSNTSWRSLSVDVIPAMQAIGYSPANFAGQQLQAYFYSPNPGSNTTEFYLDKITLDICTVQPLPDIITNSLGGLALVNNSTAFAGSVSVWAYQMQSGSLPGGPVYTTQSIQDKTYHFYNLPPGAYLVYAEYSKDAVRYTYQTTAVIPDQPPPNDVTRNLNLVLP